MTTVPPLQIETRVLKTTEEIAEYHALRDCLIGKEIGVDFCHLFDGDHAPGQITNVGTFVDGSLAGGVRARVISTESTHTVPLFWQHASLFDVDKNWFSQPRRVAITEGTAVKCKYRKGKNTQVYAEHLGPFFVQQMKTMNLDAIVNFVSGNGDKRLRALYPDILGFPANQIKMAQPTNVAPKLVGFNPRFVVMDLRGTLFSGMPKSERRIWDTGVATIPLRNRFRL